MEEFKVNKSVSLYEVNSSEDPFYSLGSKFFSGQIIMIPKEMSVPNGFLLCDGSYYPVGAVGSTYYNLYQVIKNTYDTVFGQSSPPANHFRVPLLTQNKVQPVPLFVNSSANYLTPNNLVASTTYHSHTISANQSGGTANVPHSHTSNASSQSDGSVDHSHWAGYWCSSGGSTSTGNKIGANNPANLSGDGHNHGNWIDLVLNAPAKKLTHNHNYDGGGTSAANMPHSHNSNVGSSVINSSNIDVPPSFYVKYIINYSGWEWTQYDE